MIEFRLTNDSLETPPAGLIVSGYGAMVEFIGVVRPEEDGKQIVALEYEVYKEMAQKQGDRLLQQMMQDHPVSAIQVIHRIGKIRVGEISLRVRVYSKHRQEAFNVASDFIIKLKQDIPIWKNAVFE
jgi:molybdopterin synthase catalytic subunit